MPDMYEKNLADLDKEPQRDPVLELLARGWRTVKAREVAGFTADGVPGPSFPGEAQGKFLPIGRVVAIVGSPMPRRKKRIE